MTRSYYKSNASTDLDSDLIIITYSMSDRMSFLEAQRHWLNEVVEVSPDSKIMLLGNKLDEPPAVSLEEIGMLCHRLGCLEARVSCKTGQNVK